MTTETTAGIDDFRFLDGRWTVHHRRLVARLAGSDEWQEFEGTTEVWPLLGGAGNVDDNVIDLPGDPYRAVSLRAWNPATAQWSIWWLDGRHPGALDVPVVGGFRDGVGTFLVDDTFEGRQIIVRFLWTRIDTDSPRWEQAYSADGGETWETNWLMDFRRRA